MQKNDISEKLFDAVLKVAAEEALNQEMEEMPSSEELNTHYKPSSDLDKRIKRIISQYKRKKKVALWKNRVIKVAFSTALLVIISSAVLLSVEATRNYIFNVVLKWQEDYVSIGHSDSDDPPLIIEAYKPTYLPEGFTEVSSNDTTGIIRIIYQNDMGIEIIFKQSQSNAVDIHADNQDKRFKEIKVSGHTAYLFAATDIDKQNSLIWENEGLLFTITSEIESDELVFIAESIKK